jgi:hypothetical protein
MIGKIEPFSEAQCGFSSWVEQLEQYFLVNGIEDSRKAAVLLVTIGSETYGLLRNLVSPKKPAEESYAELIAQLKNHFEPAPQKIAERYRFHCRNQKEGESIACYVAELKRLSATCDFGVALDESLRDRLVCGIRSDGVQKRLLSEPKLTFSKAVQVATAMEMAEQQGNELRAQKAQRAPWEVNRVQESKKRSTDRHIGRRARTPSGEGSSDGSDQPRCHRCLGDDHGPEKDVVYPSIPFLHY